MVKTIVFDLHFGDYRIIPLTEAGQAFLKTVDGNSTPANYAAATEAGLHTTFETAFVRDQVTQQTKEDVDGDTVSGG